MTNIKQIPITRSNDGKVHIIFYMKGGQKIVLFDMTNDFYAYLVNTMSNKTSTIQQLRSPDTVFHIPLSEISFLGFSEDKSSPIFKGADIVLGNLPEGYL